jgi:hypothetical protein
MQETHKSLNAKSLNTTAEMFGQISLNDLLAHPLQLHVAQIR